jgi:GNAT superfamily N-acetyltransferase
MSYIITTLEAKDIPDIMSAFTGSEWHTPESYLRGRLAEQEKGETVFLLARYDNAAAGFVTVKWQSGYPPFREQGIPEINDLRVLAAFRRKGIATALMDEAEKRIFARSPAAGLGVGLYADYAPAQRMYVLRGYVPDGRGLMYNNKPVPSGFKIRVDDNLLLYFTRSHP